MPQIEGIIQGNTIHVEQDLRQYEGKAVTVIVHDEASSTNLHKYRGRGPKMFPTTDAQDHVTALRENDRAPYAAPDPASAAKKRKIGSLSDDFVSIAKDFDTCKVDD